MLCGPGSEGGGAPAGHTATYFGGFSGLVNTMTVIDATTLMMAATAIKGMTPPRLVTPLRVPNTIQSGRPNMESAITHLFHRRSDRLQSTSGMHSAITK